LAGYEYSDNSYPQGFTYAKANAILQSLKPKLGIP
jgi:hypothetical protein